MNRKYKLYSRDISDDHVGGSAREPELVHSGGFGSFLCLIQLFLEKVTEEVH